MTFVEWGFNFRQFSGKVILVRLVSSKTTAQFLFRNNLVSGRRTSASGFNRIQNKELTLPDAND